MVSFWGAFSDRRNEKNLWKFLNVLIGKKSSEEKFFFHEEIWIFAPPPKFFDKDG